jgi:Fe-S cluster assembly scaffold protein SufB
MSGLMETNIYQEESIRTIPSGNTLILLDEEFLVIPAIHDRSLLIDHGPHIDIEIDGLLELVIDCRSKKDIHILVKKDTSIYLKTSNKNLININILDQVNLNIYILPQGPHELVLKAQVGAKAKLELFEITTSFALISNKIEIELLKEEALVNYFALDLLYVNAKKNTQLTIYHRAPKTKSRQSFRGIYGHSSYGSFLGKVVVDKGAYQSCAFQLYKSVILGPKAKAHTMPQLEIYNNDISASHGASIGELDKTALFYLCSRGINLEDAKVLLIESLIQDILENIHEEIKKYFIESTKKAVILASKASL